MEPRFRGKTGQKADKNLCETKALWNSEYSHRSEPMDLAILKEQAERCHRLARHADPFTQKRLLDLATEYEARIAQIEPTPSEASRNLYSSET